MNFLDCNCYFGLPGRPPASPALCPTADELQAQLDRAGIARAIAWHIAQHDVAPRRGNELLAEALATHPRLLGCWTLLPNQTGEMPVDTLLSAMKRHRIVALRAFPVAHRYLLNRVTLAPLLDELTQRRIPLLYSVRRVPPGYPGHATWSDLYQLLAEFPKLTLIVTEHGVWGADRYFRPLLDTYERTFVDTTLHFLDGGLEDFVARYGPGRMVFGSGLPERYPGGMMLALRHAEIAADAKAAIAGGTMTRLLEEIQR